MRGKASFSEELKRDAVAQITERGYPVAKVSLQLGVSQHSLYAWKKKFVQSPGDDRDAEIRRLPVFSTFTMPLITRRSSTRATLRVSAGKNGCKATCLV